MTDFITSVKAGAARYWFYASAIGIAVLYYLFDSEGKKVTQLTEEIMRMQLGAKLQAINEQANRSQEDFSNAQKNYQNLLATHGPLLTKLGVTLGEPRGSNSGPGQNNPQ